MKPRPPTVWIAALSLLAVLTASCGSTAPDQAAEPANTDASGVTTDATPGGVAELQDTPSPVGGTVKQLIVPGPETSVLVECDQDGFHPFFFTDQGDWVGCEIDSGREPGAESSLAEPVMRDTEGPVGGTVSKVTIPGPEVSLLVSCATDGFVPFIFEDEGTWAGCQTG